VLARTRLRIPHATGAALDTRRAPPAEARHLARRRRASRNSTAAIALAKSAGPRSRGAGGSSSRGLVVDSAWPLISPRRRATSARHAACHCLTTARGGPVGAGIGGRGFTMDQGAATKPRNLSGRAPLPEGKASIASGSGQIGRLSEGNSVISTHCRRFKSCCPDQQNQ
jgi:hypothetical protein